MFQKKLKNLQIEHENLNKKILNKITLKTIKMIIFSSIKYQTLNKNKIKNYKIKERNLNHYNKIIFKENHHKILKCLLIKINVKITYHSKRFLIPKFNKKIQNY